MTCLSAHMYRQISKCTDKNPKKHYWGGSCPPLATLMSTSIWSMTWSCRLILIGTPCFVWLFFFRSIHYFPIMEDTPCSLMQAHTPRIPRWGQRGSWTTEGTIMIHKRNNSPHGTVRSVTSGMHIQDSYPAYPFIIWFSEVVNGFILRNDCKLNTSNFIPAHDNNHNKSIVLWFRLFSFGVHALYRDVA